MSRPFRSWHPAHVGCNILVMANSHLLAFEAVPQTVLLEGFDEECLKRLGMFMAGLSGAEKGNSSYRVLAGGPGRRQVAATEHRKRRPRQRHVFEEGEDLVVMPGGRVRLAPGRAEATVEWVEGSGRVDGFVAATLLEIAISHALALNGYVVNHAAAIELDDMALLAVGPSRSGKSTLGAAVLAAGGAVVSDDLNCAPVSCGTSTGVTITVAAGNDLQAAIDSAQSGDTVVVEAGADFVGVVFAPSRRQVSVKRAAEIAAGITGNFAFYIFTSFFVFGF